MSGTDDPLQRARDRLADLGMHEDQALGVEKEAAEDVARWLAAALRRPQPDARTAREGVLADA